MNIKISLYEKILFLIGIIFIISIIFFIIRGAADLLVLGFLFLLYIATLVIIGLNNKLKKSDEYKKHEKELTKVGLLLIFLLLILTFAIPIIIAVAGIEQYSIVLLVAMGIFCIPAILLVKYGTRSTK